jgi:hypothetical protein
VIAIPIFRIKVRVVHVPGMFDDVILRRRFYAVRQLVAVRLGSWSPPTAPISRVSERTSPGRSAAPPK